MTFQEILRAKGLTDADIEAIMGDMKQNKIFTTSHENMDVRYPKLKGEHDTLVTQHGEATQLIEQLKAGAEGNEALQGKITQYESTIGELRTQLAQSQLDSAIQIALLEAKATDVDYMTFRLKEKGDLELDDQGHIKGIEDHLAGLKTQYPAFFASASAQREVQPQRLPDRSQDGGATVTQEQFQRMGYQSRVKLRDTNPELYDQLTKSKG